MLFPTVSPPSTLSSLPSRSFRTELTPSYFQWFPLCPPSLPKLSLPPPCHRFRIAPSQRNSPQAISHSFPSVHPVVASSQRSSPQAISHGFPSVHPVVASISLHLAPNGALPKLFAMVSPTSTLSSLPSPSFPTELSPSYFPQFPFRPPCRRFHLPPSPRSSPQAISHDFPRWTSTLSLELSPSYFPRFPFRPARRRFHRVPSPQSSPQAPCSRFHLALLLLPYRSFPTDLSPCYFPRFPRPSTLSSLP